MNITALAAIVAPGEDEFLYVFDSESKDLLIIDFHEENAVTIDATYAQPFLLGDDELSKHFIRMVVSGSGENVTGTLFAKVDGNVLFIQELAGMYDKTDGTLFFQEFDPTLITGKILELEIKRLRGVNLEILSWRVDGTFIDAPEQ